MASDSTRSLTRNPSTAAWLKGGGEMGELIRSLDWAATPIGPMDSWSPALRMMVRFLLANRFPLLLWWGPQYVSIYNDPYRPVLGNKHPWALGQPVSTCWSEIWQILRPLIDTPFNGGPATWNEDIGLEINRHGFVEETHFTIAYSPVPDETVATGIGGVLATVHEITEKIVAERRVVALRDLGARVGDAKTVEDACAIAAGTLSGHSKDVPFVLLYLIDADRRHARLAGASGVEGHERVAPALIDLEGSDDNGWPLAVALQSDAMQMVTPLEDRFASVPRGPWSDPPNTAVVMPIPSSRAGEPVGAIVAGVSARLKLDEYYRDFFELVRTQIATAINHARAYEEERQRAEALAEIDRAKTTFFSNVSHEFRTPLTLLVGPIQDGLADLQAPLPPAQRERQEIAHRNALRLLRLVNTLLDFSRIEAGRMDASFEPTDLAPLTTELASVFRSAVERAGLELVVECAALPEPVYVDRDMWEKIVLNLLSNALKFTFEGQIRVELRADDGRVDLRVADTGVGIPEADLPRMFERFHRVKDTRARTNEGTGIGLALVQELVRLHGGTVSVSSEEGRGTTFTVSIPTGTSHLPQNRISVGRQLTSTNTAAIPYVEEALRWLPASNGPASLPDSMMPAPAVASGTSDMAARVLIADDNADMREYVSRILGQSYRVEAVADGQAALDRIRAHAPDLVVADVMMPKLDGFGLLAEIRADEQIRALPVVLLSARAGEEARIEGLHAGADEYLVKPFSARELLASVASQLKLSSLRRESERALRYRSEQYLTLLNQAPLGVYLVDADFRIREVNPVARPAFGDMPDVIGRDFDEVMHVLRDKEEADDIVRIFRRTLHTGESYVTPEPVELRTDWAVTGYYEWRLDRVTLPDGRFGLVCYFHDISEQRQAAAAKAHLAAIIDSADDAIISKDLDGVIQSSNAAAERLFGYTADELVGRPVRILIPPDRQSEEDEILARLRRGERIEHFETVRVTKDGRSLELSLTVSPVRDASGRVIGASKIARDISGVRQAEAERVMNIQEASRLKDEFLASLSHELRTPLNAILGYARMLRTGMIAPDKREKAIDTIERNATSLTQIVEDVLDISRIVAGKIRLNVQAVDFPDIVRTAIDAVAPAAEAKGVRIETVLDPRATPISGDPERLQQVLWNLLSNAVKFTSRGGRAQVRLERVDSHVEVTVSDTGIGIPPEFLPHVFERFRQADAGTARQRGGLGLGLSIARQLIELHGGTIEASSSGIDQGATFRVKIPLMIVHPAPGNVSRVHPRADGGPRKVAIGDLRGVHVLAVDDEPDALSLVTEVLEAAGARVTRAGSAAAALAQLDMEVPDVIVADLGMPTLDGFGFIDRVRRHSNLRVREVPAAALTAYARSEDRVKALRAGFQIHVAKPIDPSELVTTIAGLAKRFVARTDGSSDEPLGSA